MSDAGVEEDVCPEVEQQEFNQFMRVLGLLFWLAYTIYMLVTSVWFYLRRKHPWLRKRRFPLMVIVAAGLWCEITVASLGNFTGRRTFPCDLHLWLTLLIIPLAGGGVVSRLVLVYNQARYNQFVLRQGRAAMSGLDAPLFQQRSLVESLRLVAHFFFVRCGEYEDLLESHVDSDESIDEFALGASTLIKRKQSTDQVRLERKNAVLIAMHQITRMWFAYVVLSGFMVLAFVTIIIQYALPDSPYGRGCNGCHIDPVGFAMLGIIVTVIVVVGTYMLYKVRHEPDPLALISEIKLLFACSLVAVAGTVLSVIDIGGVRVSGDFDWTYICVVASIALYTIMCPLQIWRTYQVQTLPHGPSDPSKLWAGGGAWGAGEENPQSETSMEFPEPSDAEVPPASSSGSFVSAAAVPPPPASRATEDSQFEVPTLDKVLSTRAGRKIFKAYLATEYTVESLYFIDTVGRYRNTYDRMDSQEITSFANDIYRTFIKEGSMLEVSLQASTKRAILKQLGDPTKEHPPVHLFDVASEEVYHNLSSDTFPRFLRSKFFQDWAMPSLAV